VFQFLFFKKLKNEKQKNSILQRRAFLVWLLNRNGVCIEKLKCKIYKSAKISASCNEKHLRLWQCRG
jgi:hypothetical protein